MLIEAGDTPNHTQVQELLPLRNTKVADPSTCKQSDACTAVAAQHTEAPLPSKLTGMTFRLAACKHPDGLGTLCAIMNRVSALHASRTVYTSRSEEALIKPGCTGGDISEPHASGTGWSQQDRRWRSKAQQQHNICRSLPPSQVRQARWCCVAVSCLCCRCCGTRSERLLWQWGARSAHLCLQPGSHPAPGVCTCMCAPLSPPSLGSLCLRDTCFWSCSIANTDWGGASSSAGAVAVISLETDLACSGAHGKSSGLHVKPAPSAKQQRARSLAGW
jgi:hypothetical protein